MKKVLGMGNAIVDVVTFIENDDLLAKLDISKGSMQLIDAEKVDTILSEVIEFERHMVTGGSASNTINGLAKLGVKTGFIGKIGDDEVGEFFKSDAKNNGVRTHLQYSDLLSAQCFSLVSPDTERTMCTFLGAACELEPEDLTIHMFGGYDYFHIEGYLVQNHELIKKAILLAKELGLKVSIDLASYNVVEENLDFLKDMVKNYVDVVFANEDEARALTGLDTEDALHEISKNCEIAVVNVGKNGSLIKSADQKHKIEAISANCIDTTGAGDLFAAGFLYGLTQNQPIEVCGKIGALTAGNIVEVVGAKMGDDRWDNIKEEINKLIL